MRMFSLMRQEDGPVPGRRIVFGRGHYLEVSAAFIGADVKETFAVIDVVAMFLFTRKEHGEIVLRAV